LLVGSPSTWEADAGFERISLIRSGLLPFFSARANRFCLSHCAFPTVERLDSLLEPCFSGAVVELLTLRGVY
jgi:hypothetical protein